MEKTIYLMRHGRTIFNILKIVQGYGSDSPLTIKARKKGKEIAKYICEKNIKFDNVYASDTMRATKTAKIVTKNKYKVIKVRDLRELKFGDLEKTHQHLSFTTIFDTPGSFDAFNGETPEQGAKRIYDCLTSLIEKEENNQILCVSSSCVMMSFLKYYANDRYIKIREINRFLNYTTIVITYENGKFKVKDIIEF